MLLLAARIPWKSLINQRGSSEPNSQYGVNPPPIGIVNFTDVNDGELLTTIMRMGIVRWDRVAEAEAAAGAQGNSMSWLDTMTARECAFSLCPRSFTDWSYANGVLMPGSTTQSKLHQQDAEPGFEVAEDLIFNATDP
ncbi:hypothetical protein LA080_014660 [Diaporthe eres]|nr:hypothetical protein LA080_014660 [Diaporthe eres]